MGEGAKGTINNVYALDTGEGGSARLRLLDQVYGRSTRQLLFDAGLREGMRALDLACGIGTVACWMAATIGSSGSLVAGDVNPDQLVVAKSHCSKCEHTPVEYIETSAYDTGFPAESFDLVHTRLLLCHLAEPDRVLREVYRLLKPGGAFVCQDLNLSSIYCSKESSAYRRMLAHCLAMGAALGVDYNYGVRLPAAVMEAGFRSPEIRLEQPAYLKGPEKRLWERTFAEVTPTMVLKGVATEDEWEGLFHEMREVAADEGTYIAQACLPGVIAVK
jgi:ubiquinone/menaquinone biosynthesis C-methylase UbiE